MKKMKLSLSVLLIMFSFSTFFAGIDALTSVKTINEEIGKPTDSNFTWKDRGVIVTPQNQGEWGSCAIFASISIFETLIARETGDLVDLSEQHFINNTNCWSDASGVSPEKVFKFLIENGIVYDETLPYTGRKKKVTLNPEYNYKLGTWGSALLVNNSPKDRIKIVKEHVINYGPVISNLILFEDLDRYESGVYTVGKNAKEVAGHWVVILGWQDDENMESGGYWICKNSWGVEWGEEGYFNIAYNDASGIDDYILYYVESL